MNSVLPFPWWVALSKLLTVWCLGLPSVSGENSSQQDLAPQHTGWGAGTGFKDRNTWRAQLWRIARATQPFLENSVQRAQVPLFAARTTAGNLVWLKTAPHGNGRNDFER